jgi:hypothetical protein
MCSAKKGKETRSLATQGMAVVFKKKRGDAGAGDAQRRRQGPPGGRQGRCPLANLRAQATRGRRVGSEICRSRWYAGNLVI